MNLGRAKIFLTGSPNEAWSRVIAPWLARHAPEFWQRELPSLVVAPTRAQINFLKGRSLDEGNSYLGLSFVTPAALRALLASDDAQPGPADLRLLLAIAATTIDSPNEPEKLAAKSVLRSPGLLLKILNRLQTAGWKFEDVALTSFAPIVKRFRDLLGKCEWCLPAEIEQRRWQLARTASEPRFSTVLIVGFDSAHWADWFLLRTTVALAENATVVLEEPRALSDVDLGWIGSWEEEFGEAERTASLPSTPNESLFSEAEMRGSETSAKRFDFLIGINSSEQAEAIARRCVRDLAEKDCTRLGIIFPRAGGLARLVAHALTRLDLPHHDGIAHIVPGIFEAPDWQAWMACQRAPRLESFTNFLKAAQHPEAWICEKILRQSYEEILLDDLEVLREFCAQQSGESFATVAKMLREFSFLPERGTPAKFLESAGAAFDSLGWTQRKIDIEKAGRSWTTRVDVEIGRGLFLRWLEETAESSLAERASAGGHPYARLQLLTIAQAQNQEWSHLILAGCNEGEWPPPAGAEFVREEEIRDFNRSVQQLNRRASRQGQQGEGHLSVRDGHTFYLGPLEQRAIALRQIETLFDTTTHAITLTANLVHDDAPERFWNPSESFTQRYFETKREPLTQSALQNLQRETALLPNETPATANVRQTLVAFAARRDASQPAGEYDFAVRPNEFALPDSTFSVSDFQEMVSAPAIIWMKKYLGVKAPEEIDRAWGASSGRWVHAWLAGLGEKGATKFLAAFPPAAAIDRRIEMAADERRAILTQLCNSLGRIVPDWWTSGWLNARYLARHLGWKISGIKNWSWLAAEMPIGDRTRAMPIADGVELRLRGKIDIVLSPNDCASFADATAWIVDYKTGSDKKLTSGDLHDTLVKGKTLQLALYAFAIRALGANKVSASIVAPGIREVAPQLDVEALLSQIDIFADLAAMQRTGIFGMKGEIRPAFGYGPMYPLATLKIDTDILDDKWQLTHPHLVLEKEEWMT